MSDFDILPAEEAAFCQYMLGFDAPTTPKKPKNVFSLLTPPTTKSPSARSKRQPRVPRGPRKYKPGDYRSDLSANENHERGVKRKMTRHRRNQKKDKSYRPAELNEAQYMGDDGLWRHPGDPDQVQRYELRTDSSDVSDADLSAHPTRRTKAQKKAKRLEFRRDGRSKTPEWIEVPHKDFHKFKKITKYQGKNLSLLDYSLRAYAEDVKTDLGLLCGRCPGQHSKADCPLVAQSEEESYQGDDEEERCGSDDDELLLQWERETTGVTLGGYSKGDPKLQEKVDMANLFFALQPEDVKEQIRGPLKKGYRTNL